MNKVLDRLTDAMSAAAGTVRDEELRPLTMPQRRRRQCPGPGPHPSPRPRPWYW